MMQAEIAVLRFGLGARPGDLAAAADQPRAWLMSQIRGPAPLAVNSPLAPSDQIFAGLMKARDERQKMKQASRAESADAKAVFNAIRAVYQPHYRAQVLARAQSAALTTRPSPNAWCTSGRIISRFLPTRAWCMASPERWRTRPSRPHVAGRFVDLLTAVEQHPAMIAFLDNQYSVGEDSTTARFASRFRSDDSRQPKRRFGINENLAREILELHTLGVNGGYSQADVTSFAQIITGWSVGGGNGRLAGGVPGRFYFRDNLHEPGSKVFLGKTYTEEGQRQGEAVLADLAHRPETAKFIATKLVRHFIADDPPPAAVDRVSRAFLRSGGDLPQVYAALIESPESWDANPRKFKTPEDFVFSTLRALNVSPAQPEEVIRTFDLLGQRQYTPGSQRAGRTPRKAGMAPMHSCTASCGHRGSAPSMKAAWNPRISPPQA